MQKHAVEIRQCQKNLTTQGRSKLFKVVWPKSTYHMQYLGECAWGHWSLGNSSRCQEIAFETFLCPKSHMFCNSQQEEFQQLLHVLYRKTFNYKEPLKVISIRKSAFYGPVYYVCVLNFFPNPSLITSNLCYSYIFVGTFQDDCIQEQNLLLIWKKIKLN